jgi:hypothetical protein
MDELSTAESPAYVTLADGEEPDQAPNTDNTYQTIVDYRWYLRRFTPPGWDVSKAEFEDNDHSAAKCTVLKATLKHEEGDAIHL